MSKWKREIKGTKSRKEEVKVKSMKPAYSNAEGKRTKRRKEKNEKKRRNAGGKE
jgi:hypothetical protein